MTDGGGAEHGARASQLKVNDSYLWSSFYYGGCLIAIGGVGHAAMGRVVEGLVEIAAGSLIVGITTWVEVRSQ